MTAKATYTFLLLEEAIAGLRVDLASEERRRKAEKLIQVIMEDAPVPRRIPQRSGDDGRLQELSVA